LININLKSFGVAFGFWGAIAPIAPLAMRLIAYQCMLANCGANTRRLV